MDEIMFEIKKQIGVITEFQTGWKKELNIVAWNGNPPKYDIRDWSPDHTQMSRGITLHPYEMQKVKELLENLEV